MREAVVSFSLDCFAEYLLSVRKWGGNASDFRVRCVPFFCLTDDYMCAMMSVHCDDVELSCRGCMYVLLRKVRAGA